jgi:hypothetical protein
VVLLPSETLLGVELLKSLHEDVCTLAFDIERIYLYVFNITRDMIMGRNLWMNTEYCICM